MEKYANITRANLKIFKQLLLASYNDKVSLKIADVYGQIGAKYTFYAAPFMWILPSIVTVMMFVVFKRKGILGVVQKFLLATMTIDLVFTVISSTRDGFLFIYNNHFGYLEYEYCNAVLISFYIQLLLQGTSIWLKAAMTMHQYISIRFPLRLRQLKTKRILLFLTFIHIGMITMACYTYCFPALKTAKIFQELKKGSPVRVINSCIYVAVSRLERIKIDNISLVFIIYFLLFPVVLHVCLVVALLHLMVKQLRLVKLFSTHSSRFSKNVKYIVLMKITVCLGISFFLQELPMIVLSITPIFIFKQSDAKIANFSSIALSIQTLSFSVGKTLDFFIYVSLSPTFRSELKRMTIGCCLKKTKSQTEETKISRMSSRGTSCHK